MIDIEFASFVAPDYLYAFEPFTLIASLIAAGSAIVAGIQSRKTKHEDTLEMMHEQNELNLGNQQRTVDLDKTQINRAVNDARNSGINPLSVLGSPSYSASAVSSPSTTPQSGFDTSVLAPILGFVSNLSEQRLESSKVKSENLLNSAHADYLRSLTEGNDLSNTFLGDTLPLKTKLTKSEYENAITLQGYFASNPQLLQSVAEKQKVLNENLDSSTFVNRKQLSVLDSVVSKNASDISLNEKKIASMFIEDKFTLSQIQELTDRNLRDNYSNVGYLIDRMNAVSNSSLPSDVKADKLALLRDLYDNASGLSRMRLQYEYDKNLQDSRNASVAENVDKYIGIQNKNLDWQKTQFGWNKVFEVVDKTADILVPWYQQKQGQDFSREMQQNQFEHDFDIHNSAEDNKFVRDKNKYQHDKEMQEMKQDHDKWMYERKHSDNMNEYDSEVGYYDENGYYHRQKSRRRR